MASSFPFEKSSGQGVYAVCLQEREFYTNRKIHRPYITAEQNVHLINEKEMALEVTIY